RARRGSAPDDQSGRRRAGSGAAPDRHAGRGGVRRRVGGRGAAALPSRSRMTRMRGRVAIVGAAESDEMGRLPPKSAFALHAEAARNALADAGLEKDDVDAVFTAGLWMASEAAEYLGLRPRYVDGTPIGGCPFIAQVEHAMGAVAAGPSEVGPRTPRARR